MNTYYLKKFRKEAFEKYGIQKDGIYYEIIYRRSNVIYSSFLELEVAKIHLHELRRRFILEMVNNERNIINRLIDKELNKQLAKL